MHIESWHFFHSLSFASPCQSRLLLQLPARRFFPNHFSIPGALLADFSTRAVSAELNNKGEGGEIAAVQWREEEARGGRVIRFFYIFSDFCFLGLSYNVSRKTWKKYRIVKLKTACFQYGQFYYVMCRFISNFAIFTQSIDVLCVQRVFFLYKNRYFFQVF